MTQPTPHGAALRLKSAAFRAEREASWRELEALVGRVEKGGLAALAPRELARVPVLFRAALSSLSVARAISLDELVMQLGPAAGRARLRRGRGGRRCRRGRSTRGQHNGKDQ